MREGYLLGQKLQPEHYVARASLDLATPHAVHTCHITEQPVNLWSRYLQCPWYEVNVGGVNKSNDAASVSASGSITIAIFSPSAVLLP